MMQPKRAIIFLAWGKKYIDEVLNCINKSILPDYDKILITDQESDVPSGQLTVIRAQFKMEGLLRKSELIDFLPPQYDSYLFLDSDTQVIADIELGFIKAEQYGIALSPAPHYSLDYFWGFNMIMKQEGVSRSGQLQYNTGVIFFIINDATLNVFRLWRDLAGKYIKKIQNDQPFFTLALEKTNFNPYTLSIGYNYRGFGDSISGIIRIWHSHGEMPDNINEFEKAWPPRQVINGRVIHATDSKIGRPAKETVWLASFPRSGNTMLRTILLHCFGLTSGSAYPNDLGGNKTLEKYVGHIEHGDDGKIHFPANSLPLIKTHESPRDSHPAIYVVRDGRRASVSMWNFYKKEISLEVIITGRNRFGTWSQHLVAWHPWDRPNTLLLKYEDLVNDLPKVLQEVSRFLGREIIAHQIPERKKIADADGQWVRNEKASRDFPGEYDMLFDQINGKMMSKMGYSL